MPVLKTKLSTCIIKHQTIMTYGNGGIAPHKTNVQHHIQAALSPSTHWIRGWVNPRAGVAAEAKIKISTTDENQTPFVQPVALSL
jgi:hypothetical protein